MNNISNPQRPAVGAQQVGSQSEQQRRPQVPTLETLPTALPGLPAQEGVPQVLEDCRCHHSCCKSARWLSRCYQEWQNQVVQWSQHRSPISQAESRTTSMKYEAGRKKTSASTSGRMKKSSGFSTTPNPASLARMLDMHYTCVSVLIVMCSRIMFSQCLHLQHCHSCL